LSKLISDSIDLDNIDNVFRMAYHMGITFRREAPIQLAQMMYISDGTVIFEENAKTYLEEWYSVRQKVYKFLLLNPQEFSGKYMLTEAMDVLFECISQDKAQGHDIKWNYTDYELMEELNELKEVWIKRKSLLAENLDADTLCQIKSEDNRDEQKAQIKLFLESLTLSVPIKEKGKTGETYKLLLSSNYSYEVTDAGISI